MVAVLEKESTVSMKGQTTIPIEVREVLGVGAGDRVTFRVEGEQEVRLYRSGPGEDPALIPFLNLVANDMHNNPEKLVGLSDDLRACIEHHTVGATFDRDDVIEGDVGL